jgi:hypothetical protein
LAVNLNVVLTHYPVVNKDGEIIASAVTNLDLHDIARLVRTYGVKAFYVVTPLEDQKQLVEKIIAHWTEGVGGHYNPDRKSALETIRVSDSIDAVAEDIFRREGKKPCMVVTCARKWPESLDYRRFRSLVSNGSPCMLLFGTAWGLASELIEKADYVLEPIYGTGGYNHLSVRSAAAVILDRVMGEQESIEMETGDGQDGVRLDENNENH